MNTQQGTEEDQGRQQRRKQLEALSEQLQLQMRQLWNPADWSDVELTMPQLRALDMLVTEPRRMSELANALGTSMQATTSLIDRLVDKGLVERTHDTVDRRVVIARLTAAGMVEMRRFYQMGQAHHDLLVDLLTDDELDTVISAFSALSDAARKLIESRAGATNAPTPNRMNEHENSELLS